MAQKIKLTESRLREMISEAIEEALKEDSVDEGWLGDKWNQVKSAYNTVANNTDSGKGFTDKIAAARKNWNSQGELNDMSNLVAQLKQFIANRSIQPTDTVAQVIQKMQSIRGNRAAQISRRGGEYYKEEE